jgi:holin-like protein
MVKQCSIIFACLAAGEFIAWIFKIPIPGSIIGMLLLTTLLQKKVVNIESVKGISQFLVSNMGFFFVPPGVAIMLYFDIISAQWFPIVTATLLSIAIVLIVTGWVHQFVNSHKFKFRSKH